MAGGPEVGRRSDADGRSARMTAVLGMDVGLKMMSRRIASAGLLAAILSGCAIAPADFESIPVVLSTSSGPVTCQLYTRERVDWDRSIDRPAKMSVEEADRLCAAEGLRRQKGGGDTQTAVTRGGADSPWPAS